MPCIIGGESTFDMAKCCEYHEKCYGFLFFTAPYFRFLTTIYRIACSIPFAESIFLKSYALNIDGIRHRCIVLVGFL